MGRAKGSKNKSKPANINTIFDENREFEEEEKEEIEVEEEISNNTQNKKKRKIIEKAAAKRNVRLLILLRWTLPMLVIAKTRRNCGPSKTSETDTRKNWKKEEKR